MSYENPTRLRIGQHGTFSGKDYRLVGRAVMGVDEDGQTYYWNEFYLAAGDGTRATLVYEETEGSVEWRLFTEFTPEFPMNAADAASKRQGDHLNLTGRDMVISRVDTAQVYRIEGSVPDGLVVGEVSNYFNLEFGNAMQVVSWIGERIEFYDGVNLSTRLVNGAFNLPNEAAGSSGTGSWLSSGSSGGYDSWFMFALKAGGVFLLIFLLFGRNFSCASSRPAGTVRHISAGAAPLTVGAAGTLKGTHYRVAAHAVVEIGEVGVFYERHEYQLTADGGQTARLVCGVNYGDNNWTLFTPLHPLQPPTAMECAAKKMGEVVNVDGVEGPVSHIFQATVKQSDNPVDVDWNGSSLHYGYMAKSPYVTLLATWNSVDASFFQGQDLPVKTVTAAFAGSSTNGN